ncbi:MAG: alkaline phosphatase family protein [Planctomycetota bacterium]
MRSVLLLNVVGLTPSHLHGWAPRLERLASEGFFAPLKTVFPAVTCPVQTTFLTGRLPKEHGIVANGWYSRDQAEVRFWRQSNRLLAGDRLFDEAKARDPAFTSAYLFWWYAMYGGFDATVTPRPAYFADGRKVPDIWTDPPGLKGELNQKFGRFPLFDFWGPRAGLASSRWIGQAAQEVIRTRRPSLALVYLPHLDYDLQRLGPDDPRIEQRVREVDQVAGELIDQARAEGTEVVAVSEYGITAVSGAVAINRVLREGGYLRVEENLVGELLDAGCSRAFAVADHQVAHVYVADAKDLGPVRRLLEATAGIERVLGEEEKRESGLDHPRSGELVAVAAADRWFSYYYWLDDQLAPDFARTVDIHRKPGYDPVELFLDPKIRLPKLKVAGALLKKRLGMRYLLDVISLDASLVKGSHGRLPDREDEGPVLICSRKRLARDRFSATDVRPLLLDLLFES